MSIDFPEAKARGQIDRMLTDAGWLVQDRAAFNPAVGPGIAVREFPLKTGFADYLLLVDRMAVGAVEAKKVGTPLSGVESQSARYSDGLPDIPPAWRKPLPFLYESTGVETFFTNGLDPDPRSRQLFAFHRPETLRAWVHEAGTLRTRVLAMPDLDRRALWAVQAEAIENLERSLRDNRPRALIQMATGTGKTLTAVNFVYRLIKYGGARRVLFLVDRGNLGRQAYKEFQQFVTPDDGRKFTELYNVQHLQANVLDDVSRVCITTVQRLYSILSGEPDFDPANEEASLFDGDLPADLPPKQVIYTRAIPIEYFDVIVIDECHRSIYNVWRQVLEYFDAFLIGLTATPSKQTFGFFHRNLVMEYSRTRVVADGINVDGEVYRIRTQITEEGSTVNAGYFVGQRDTLTRALRWERLDEDFSYAGSELDRSVVAEDQIRTVIRYFEGVPSLTKTSVAFHAKDDLPEIRYRVYQLLATLDFKAQFIVARKIEPVFRNSFQAKESAFYDHLVAQLFKNALHRYQDNRIYFAKRGSRSRQAPLQQAIQRGVQEFESTWKTKVTTRISVQAQVPSDEPCLSIVDYMNWAVFRAFTRGEMRYYRVVESKVSLLVDLYDRAKYPKNWYNRKNPFDTNKITPL